MKNSMDNLPQPFFLNGPRGAIFCLYYPPQGERRHAPALLNVPPLTEEMNQSRRMHSLMARHFAKRGRAVLLVDLYGTGDSHGDHGDADWNTWRGDLDVAAKWLSSQGHSQLGVLGTRAGALLALDFIQRHPEPIDLLVLWQPVITGNAWLTQFLRMRTALSATSKESTEELQQRLMAGEKLEIAGYYISPDLTRGLAKQSLPDHLPAQVQCAVWLEVGNETGAKLPFASRKKVEMWQTQHEKVTGITVADPPFWVSQAAMEAPELLQATLSVVESI